MLPEWVVEAYRAQAEAAGRSLEEELRRLLTDNAVRAQRDFAERAGKFRSRIQAKHGVLSDSAVDIARERERRG